jgi:hypothetical protein
MSEIVTPLLVALIGGPLMWLLYRLDSRNTKQHGDNMMVLQEIKQDIRETKESLTEHISWHAHKGNGDNGKTKRISAKRKQDNESL